ncbi:Protein of unknown function DUF45 [Parelusimicrobium proximum]|uniref:M48 family metallopeptidase n=1 Tax=Parelusimicrobium proximum TaxID=3228953 RepID=UPI003D179124
MSEIETTISDIKIFLQKLKADLPEVFQGEAENLSGQSLGKVLYEGDLYDIKITLNPDAENAARFEDVVLFVNMKSEEENPSEIVESWLRDRAKEVLAKEVKEWAEKMGVEYNNITIKNQKTMWGSCSDKKNLNFSYRIIKMPKAVREYLIIHELAHLVHMNHAQEYWSLVAQYCPDYNKHRKWLNDNKNFILSDTEVKYAPGMEIPAEEDAPEQAAVEPEAEPVSAEEIKQEEETEELAEDLAGDLSDEEYEAMTPLVDLSKPRN